MKGRRWAWGTVWVVMAVMGCSADHHAEQGRVALDAHDLAAAEQAYRKALDREPSHAEALAGLGWTYHLAGQRGAARSAFSRCVDVKEDSAECLRGLGSIALAEGQPGAAKDLLGRAQAAAPDDPKVIASLALLDLSLGDSDSARNRYQELVKRFPDDPAYRLGLSECLLRTGQHQEAIQGVEEALDLPAVPKRYRAMLWQLKARALVAASGGREDPDRCAETAPIVREWLDAAFGALEQAETSGVGLPDLPAVRRQVMRRRAVLDATCPLGLPSASEVLAGESTP